MKANPEVRKENEHIHTPSQEKGNARIVLDFILHEKQLVDNKSMTGICGICGALIRTPHVVIRYYKLLTIFHFALCFGAMMLVYNCVNDVLSQGWCFVTSLGVGFVISFLQYFAIPRILMGLCTWETVNVYGLTMEKAKEFEKENVNEKYSGIWLYAIIGLFVSLLTVHLFATY